MINNIKKIKFILNKNKKIKNDILYNYLKRKDYVEFKRRFQLNNKKIPLFVQRIKNKVEFVNNLENNYFEDYSTAYVLSLKLDFNTNNFISEVDIVFCSLDWKVIDLKINVSPNTVFNKLKQTVHVIVLSKNAINYFDIKKDDKLTPF